MVVLVEVPLNRFLLEQASLEAHFGDTLVVRLEALLRQAAVAALEVLVVLAQARLVVLEARVTMFPPLLAGLLFTRLVAVVVAAQLAVLAVPLSVVLVVPMPLEMPHQQIRLVVAVAQETVLLVLAVMAVLELCIFGGRFSYGAFC
jgi:hypothetical protein